MWSHAEYVYMLFICELVQMESSSYLVCCDTQVVQLSQAKSWLSLDREMKQWRRLTGLTLQSAPLMNSSLMVSGWPLLAAR